MTYRADVLIIGAGASGGVAARHLAEHGFDVVCLEQGDWPDRSAFPGTRPDWELAIRKDWAMSPNVRMRPEDYPVVHDDSDIEPLMYNAVGGSMIIYAGTWPRMLPSDFRVRTLDGVADDWPIAYRDLVPYYNAIDQQIGVSGLAGDPAYPPHDDYPLPPLPLGVAGRRVAEGHNQLGWHWWPEPNAILSAPYDGRRPCVQRGVCTSGCAEGAKASTDLTHWPKATAAGARLITGARVSRITLGSQGLATGAVWLDRSGVEHHQEADVVILAANAVGTARLLLLSADDRHCPDGLANSSGLVGRRLMMHPFSVVTGWWDDQVEGWQGHFGASITSYQFYETDPCRDFVRGAKWALSPVGGPLNHILPMRAGNEVWGSDHHILMGQTFGRGASWAIFGEDLPEEANRVELDLDRTDSHGIPAPRVSYRISEHSRRLMAFQEERAEESLEASGCQETAVASMIPYSGWHLMGTARMGENPANSVVNSRQQAHDVPNLYIADASVFVTSSGVNPTCTITALALRTADLLVQHRSEQKVPA